MLRRNGPVVKSVESVLRLEGSLWGERFVEEEYTLYNVFLRKEVPFGDRDKAAPQ